MQSTPRRADRAAMLAAVFISVFLSGKTARTAVRLRVSLPGRYTAKATYTALPGRSPVIALANRALAAEARKGVRDFVRMARRDMKQPGGLRLPYEHQADGTVCVARPTIASAYLVTYEFMGGAHGMTGFTTVNAGLVGGRPRLLTLRDLFQRGVPAAQVAAERVKAHLKTDPRAAWFAPDNKDFLPADADLIANFVITPAGLTFLIAPYVAGPYSAGTFSVKVPFSEFGDKLDRNGPLRDLLHSAPR